MFVIETKNYSGRIYGDEKSTYWTQVLRYGNVKNKLYNPLKQNATHAYNVKKLLGYNFNVKSYVVFVKNNVDYIKASNVIPLSSLQEVLNDGECVLSYDKMRFAYETLTAKNVYISKQEHVNNIVNQQRDIENGICPRCSGKLVLRNGKYGQFWGCSNYPNCKFIKKNTDGA